MQVDPNDIFTLGTMMVGLACLGFCVDQHPIGRKTSGVIWVLGGAMLLSNFKIVPFQAPAYSFVGNTLVPLAIPLLLFKADVRRIFRESGRVMVTFGIASLATIVGAVLGHFLLNLGEIGPKVAGVYTGAYIGGAVNLLAVSEAVSMTETEFSGTISASSVVSILALMMLVALSSAKWLLKRIPSVHMDDHNADESSAMGPTAAPKFLVTHISFVLALSFLICAAAEHVGDLLGMPNYRILLITLLAVLIANLIPSVMQKLQGELELGMFFMYIFFAAVGAGTDALQFVETAPLLFIYGMIIITVHLALVLATARLFKIDLAEAMVASGAALVGPSVTAAIAASRGWRSLVTPAIMCGIFGYAIATFLGYALYLILSGGAF